MINTAAGANIIGKQARADIVGSNVGSLQQQGILLNIAGCRIRESAAIAQHTPGGGSGYLLNNAQGFAAGTTDLAVDSGSGDILAGDLVTIDGRDYIVSADMDAGALSIGAPGLLADAADNTAVTAGSAAYAANLCFDRSAIHLLARLPKLPAGGDAADDEYTLVDPVSGLPFRVAMYKGFHAVQIHVQCAWGVACVKPAHVAILMG